MRYQCRCSSVQVPSAVLTSVDLPSRGPALTLLTSPAHGRGCRGRRAVSGLPRLLPGGLPTLTFHRVPRSRPLQLLHHRLLLLAGHHRGLRPVPAARAADAEGRQPALPRVQVLRLPPSEAEIRPQATRAARAFPVPAASCLPPPGPFPAEGAIHTRGRHFHTQG